MKKEKINWLEEIRNAGRLSVRGIWKYAQVLMNILITVLIICALTGIIVATALTVYIKNYVDTSVDVSLFRFSASQGTTTSVLYRYAFSDRANREGVPVELEGEHITGTSDSTYVTYDRIPENMINAVIAIEDKRFKTHEGVDWKRTFGAALGFFVGSDTYGGSSLTQQLVKNVTGADDYSIQRKVQEIFWALDLETKMDKEEIMELYLNVVNFGGSYYGVQAAAHNYFNKDVSELTLIECAAIAGITQNPSRYNPRVHPEENDVRRDTILYEMFDQGLITQREFEEAYKQPLQLNIPTASSEITEQQQKGINSWYTDMVINDVIDDLMEQKGLSRQVASLMVYNGGLKIYTLIDPEVQATLESVYLDDANFTEEGAQSAAIVIDPYTGDILGVVGARRQKLGNRLQNFAVDTKRPSGSAIKPLSVYAPMVDAGKINWATVTDDSPFDFVTSETGWPKNDEKWPLNNPVNNYKGLETTWYALAISTNTIAVKLLDQLGLRNSFRFCHDTLQMTDLVESVKLGNGTVVSDLGYAALGLGQLNYGISLRQLSAAYSIFPNSGIYSEAHSYLKVTDSEGTDILTSYYSGTVAISEDTACIMNHMLEKVVTDGTASSKFLGGNRGIQFQYAKTGIQVAGKTGSAGENYDRWFIGYTPFYICGVWTGYEYNNKQITITNPCLKVWDAIMTPLHRDVDVTQGSFTESNNVKTCTYCKDSGLLCTEACALDPRGSREETGYFIDGTQPTEYCTTHVLVEYDTVTKAIACPECPRENVERVALIRVDRDFNTPRDVTILDAEYAYFDLPYDMEPYLPGTLSYYYNMSLVYEVEEGKGEDGGPLATYHRTGYTYTSKPYNRICTEHFDYGKWWQRVLEEDARRGFVRSSAIDSSAVDSSSVESSGAISAAVWQPAARITALAQRLAQMKTFSLPG